MHASRAAIEHLHAIRPDVAHPGFGIFGEHQRQRDEPAAVLGPAFQNRQLVESAVAPPGDLQARSVTAAISRSGFTGSPIRASSFRRSRSARKSSRSEYIQRLATKAKHDED